MSVAHVVLDDSHPAADLVLKAGTNLRTGEVALKQIFGPLTSLEKDMLLLASAIYASDLAFKRGKAEGITRRIELFVPVTNLALLNSQVDQIRFILYRLSCDAWQLHFVQASGTSEIMRNWQKPDSPKVLLFSGGLDSLRAQSYLETRVTTFAW